MPEHIRQEPKVLVSTENLTEQEWLAYRRQGIGGSDVAAILGISPFRTARDLYDDKLNIASAVDDTGNWVALEMGHLLEPLVAQIFTKKTGLEVFQIKKMFQHPQYPFMLADVDYFVRLPNGEIALLEIKTTNYNAKDHWWKDGEEYVPVYYETQGRHYMAVMDMDEIFYCCLYGNNEDEAIIRHLYRDREYEQEMVYLEREFWHDHILTRIPPPYTEDGSLILESLRRRLGAADKTGQRPVYHHAAVSPLTGAKTAGRSAGQNAGHRNAAAERPNGCQTQRQLHGDGGVRRYTVHHQLQSRQQDRHHER